MPGFREIRLPCPRLKETRDFYHQIVGLALVEDRESIVCLQAGGTRLCFTHATEPTVYHFAFNISENKFDLAVEWLRARTPLLVEDGQETFHFVDWNAHAVYYLDPAGNIGELIARHDLRSAAAGPFDAADIINVSELGVVLPDFSRQLPKLQEALGLPAYRPIVSDEFRAVGDEHQLLIVVKEGRPWARARNIPARVSPVWAELDGPTMQWRPGDLPYQIRRSSK